MAWNGATPTAPETQLEPTNGTSITSSSVTLTAGRLYLVGVWAGRGDSVDFAAPTSVVCNGTQAFAIVHATNGVALFDTSSATRRGLWVGYCIPAATVTGTIVATFAATYEGFILALVEVASGFNAAETFLQSAKVIDADGTGTSTTLTFGAGMAANSLVVAFIAAADSSAIAPDAAYTELFADLEQDADVAGTAHYSTAPDTTMTFTYVSGAQMAAIGVEVQASPPGGKGSGGKGKGGNNPGPGEPPKKPLRTSLSKSWKWDRGWR